MTYFKNVKYKVLVILDDDGRRGGIGWLDINTPGVMPAAFCAALRWRGRHEGGINRWLIEKTGGLSGIV